jgi:predicted transcriptional regulator
MTEDLWDKPIELPFDNADHFHRVGNNREALAFLKKVPSFKSCKTVAQARKMCLRAIAGRCSSAEAQAAFIKAARAAGFLRDV